MADAGEVAGTDAGNAAATLAPPPAPTPGAAMRGDTRLVNLLRGAVEAAADDNGWAALGAVGKQIANRASLDPRNHGYRKLVDLFTAIGLFEVRRQDLGVYVRDRRHPEARAGGRPPQ